jgi:hypothetical protein
MATYHITNATELQNMNNDKSGDYILDNNIDLTGVTWTPVGTVANPFLGSFDGQNYTISNLTFNSSSNNFPVGIFGQAGNSSTLISISNVKLNNIILDVKAATDYGTGSLVGILERGTVENCFASNVSINTLYGRVAGLVGGLIGKATANTGSEVSGCGVSGFSCRVVRNSCGGLIGNSDIALIQESYAVGVNISVTSGDPYGVGGLVGYSGVNAISTSGIFNCYAQGSISVASACVGHGIGGLVGHARKFTIGYAYADVSINGGAGAYYVGGLVGYLMNSHNAYYISECFSTGVITNGSIQVGGFIGGAPYDTGTFTNNSWWTGAYSQAVGYFAEDPAGAYETLAEIDWGTDETIKTNFNYKTHAVYAQGGLYPWDFTTPIWYERYQTLQLPGWDTIPETPLAPHQKTPFIVELRDKHGNVKRNILPFVSNIKWEWNRLGGCGLGSMIVYKPYRDITFEPLDDIQITIKEDGVNKLVYRGYISNVTPSLTSEQSIKVETRGYFDFLRKLVVHEEGDTKTYIGGLISTIVDDIVTTFVTPNTAITKGTIDTADFQCDTIDFLTTVADALDTLAQLAGNVEYGVDEHLVFFWRTEDEAVRYRFFVGNNVEMLERRIDFEQIVNKVYLIGGDVEGAKFKRMLENTDSQDLYNLSEKIVSNGSITTQPVADQYIGSILKEYCQPIYSIRCKVSNTKIRLEDTIPIGAISVYDAAYDKTGVGDIIIGEAADGGSDVTIGLAIDGGSEITIGGEYASQIDRIQYEFSNTEERFNITIQFGDTILQTAAKIKQLELQLSNIQQY